jgi:multiple antibiotic resistance protein
VTAAERWRTALAATIILTVAVLAGRPILAAFGISMPALQAAGGLVIVLMGLEMLHGAPTRVQHDEAQQSTEDRILVPLPMPLLAGPGAIIGIVLGTAARLGSVIGVRGQRILLRFMGLILAAVGAEVLLAGIYTLVPRS